MNYLTELREGLLISLGAIRANKLRSVLTTLGIVIGIVTVTLMGTVIEGINHAFLHDISNIGTDVLYVSRFNWFASTRQEWLAQYKRPVISLAEVDTLQKQMTLAEAIAPVVSDTDAVKYKKRGSDSSPVIASTDQYQITSGVTVAQGHFLTAAECDGGRPVCVVGSELATNLFLRENPIGQKLFIEQHPFEVVGVLEKQGGFEDMGGIDNTVIISVPQMTAHIWHNPPYEIHVKVKNVYQLDDAAEELRVIMRRTRHIEPGAPDTFSINQQSQFLEMFHKIAGTLAAIGIFVTSLSLFVGGIGIMNIMFVSVAERTREIGVRKAIGAKRRTILLQFLIEAACICLIGGVIALLIAWPSTILLRKAMPAEMSPLVVCIALFVSALGTVVGFPLFLALALRRVDAMHAAVVTGVLPLACWETGCVAIVAALQFANEPKEMADGRAIIVAESIEIVSTRPFEWGSVLNMPLGQYAMSAVGPVMASLAFDVATPVRNPFLYVFTICAHALAPHKAQEG